MATLSFFDKSSVLTASIVAMAVLSFCSITLASPIDAQDFVDLDSLTFDKFQAKVIRFRLPVKTVQGCGKGKDKKVGWLLTLNTCLVLCRKI